MKRRLPLGLITFLPLIAACGTAGGAATSAAVAPAAYPGARTEVLALEKRPQVAEPSPVSDAMTAYAPPMAPPPAIPARSGGGASSGQSAQVATDAHGTSMLIYTANLSMAVYQVDKGVAAVEKIGLEAGGYLSTRGDNAITVRVPRARFEEALRRIEVLGDVLHRNVTAEDVTDQYVDLEVRLKNARAMRDRLQQLLKNASVKDAIEIEKELGRVTGEIESMEGRLGLLKDRIAFSTIAVSFEPVRVQPVRESHPLPFSWLNELGLPTLLRVTE